MKISKIQCSLNIFLISIESIQIYGQTEISYRDEKLIFILHGDLSVQMEYRTQFVFFLKRAKQNDFYFHVAN